jgi:DNA-binding CsgD family transcriptional regulator
VLPFTETDDGEAERPATSPAELRPWREAVRRATAAVGLIDLPSTRYLELSPRAQELVGSGSRTGLDVLAPDQREDAAAIVTAARAGAIDGSETRRRSWRRLDGSSVEVGIRGRVLRLDGGSFGLFVARALASGPADPLAGVTDDPVGWRDAGVLADARVVATLDRRWRVVGLTGDTERFGDVLREGTSISEATDPDDLARLLFAFAGATTHVSSTTRLRMRSGDDPIAVDAEVARSEDGRWRLALATLHRPVTELAGALQRIAVELQHVQGAARTGTEDVLRVPGVTDLPPRQREIVVRLSRGERVGTIASALYISPKTVRNHLTAVFRTFGVHSQEELLAVLRRDRDGPPSAG